MKEKLTCTKCSKTWTRNRLRGRKPLLCPSCLKISSSSIQPAVQLSRKKLVRMATPKEKNSNKDKIIIDGPSKWQCSSCLVSVTIEIGIYDPPTHACRKRLKKNYPLERVSKIIKNHTNN